MLNRKHRKFGIRNHLETIFENDSINPVTNALLAVGEAISRYADVIGQISNEQEQLQQSRSIDDVFYDQYLDSIVEEKIYLIEDLLAICFVVCQTDIGYVVNRVSRLDEYCKTHYPQGLPSLITTKKELMKRDTNIVIADITAIQIINAYANYFKHKDEWTKPWGNILASPSKDRRTIDTINILQATGATENSTDNFRNIARLLGNSNFSSVSKYINILNDWRRDLRNSIEIDLRSANIL